MNDAIDRNNKGIAFLEQGRNEEALAELKVAAQNLHALTRELHRRNVFDDISILNQSTSSRKWIPTDNAFVKSTAILLAPTDSPTTSCTIESAIILFNMALCYHLDSMKPNSMQDATRNAKTLYEMAYTLAAQTTADIRSHQIILISLNNLGQLEHEMGNFDASKRYFDDLSSYVVWLGSSGGAHLVSDRHDFMINALVLRNPNICAGAA